MLGKARPKCGQKGQKYQILLKYQTVLKLGKGIQIWPNNTNKNESLYGFMWLYFTVKITLHSLPKSEMLPSNIQDLVLMG